MTVLRLSILNPRLALSHMNPLTMQVPNMIVMAPSDEAELIHMVATAAAMDRHPICFRFPRGNALGLDLAAQGIIGYKGQPMQVQSRPHSSPCMCMGRVELANAQA